MSDTYNFVCIHCGQVNRLPNRPITKANCGKCQNSLLDTGARNTDASAFDLHVANNDVPIIVDFWAAWCGPCQMMAPIFEKTAAKFPLKARFLKVDTEAQQTLAARFNIRSIPTLIAFKGGKEIDRVSGALQEGQLEQWVNQLL